MPVPIPGSKVGSDSQKVKFLMIFGRPKTRFFEEILGVPGRAPLATNHAALTRALVASALGRFLGAAWGVAWALLGRCWIAAGEPGCCWRCGPQIYTPPPLGDTRGIPQGTLLLGPPRGKCPSTCRAKLVSPPSAPGHFGCVPRGGLPISPPSPPQLRGWYLAVFGKRGPHGGPPRNLPGKPFTPGNPPGFHPPDLRIR